MIRRSKLACSVTSIVLAVGVFACASGGAAASGRSSVSYGYMIPGPGIAAALRITASDTLPELESRTTISSVVENAITQEASASNMNNRCSRRFGGPTVYTVIFHRACDASAGPEADPFVIVGFSADGRIVGRVRWNGPSTVTALVPVRRF